MKQNNSRGIVMFAHNNTEIDYLKMAVVNANLIQRHLGLSKEQITIVTDESSYDYASKTLTKRLLNSSATYIIRNKNIEFKNKNHRIYSDTVHTRKSLSFYNYDRADAYDITPYDETIVIDADYLILSDTLNHCWGHHNDIMMNYRWKDVNADRKYDFSRVAPAGITMYWATVVYFRKTPYTESFFEIVKHVRENPEFYRELYRYSAALYRNDYAFSVAAHMMAGFKDREFPQLPFTLYKTFDTDDIHSTHNGELVMFLDKPNHPGDYTLCRWAGVDLHVMNKWAINRISEGLLAYAKDKKTTRLPKQKVGQSNTTKRSNSTGRKRKRSGV